jgi:hypothetical protein
MENDRECFVNVEHLFHKLFVNDVEEVLESYRIFQTQIDANKLSTSSTGHRSIASGINV